MASISNPNLKNLPPCPCFEYTFQPIVENSPFLHRPCLSPIPGSFEVETSDESARRCTRSPTNECPLSELQFESDPSNRTLPENSTNELPLTELNLSLFTSEAAPSEQQQFVENEPGVKIVQRARENWPQHRSFSDPNILKTEQRRECGSGLVPEQAASCYPFSFYPPRATSSGEDGGGTGKSPNWHELRSSFCARSPTNLLSFLSSPRSYSRTQSAPGQRAVSALEGASGGAGSQSASGSAGRRHRHSIAGQMSYFKLLGYGFGIGVGPVGLKKLQAGSANSLFSTAVISGSSSAPNLRDMIPAASSASGKHYCDFCRGMFGRSVF